MKDSEDNIISMAEKNESDINLQEESKTRHNIRTKFWKQLLHEMNAQSDLYRNVNPSQDNWIPAGSGISSTVFNFVMSRTYARVELLISRAIKDENKFIFDEILKYIEQVEQGFGDQLTWERLNDKKASRIKYQMDNVNVFNEDDWPKMINFMVKSMVRFHGSLKKPLQNVQQELIKMIEEKEL